MSESRCDRRITTATQHLAWFVLLSFPTTSTSAAATAATVAIHLHLIHEHQDLQLGLGHHTLLYLFLQLTKNLLVFIILPALVHSIMLLIPQSASACDLLAG